MLLSGTSANTYAIRTLDDDLVAGGGMLAPSSGVVVRWRIRAADVTGPTSLRILRAAAPLGHATGAGTSATVTPAPSGVSTFATRLPLRAGDILGVDAVRVGVLDGKGTTSLRSPVLLDSESREPHPTTGSYALPINADLEPDCDADGFGDETQDVLLSGLRCSRGRRCAGKAPTHVGTAGRDALRGGRRADVLLGLDGSDRPARRRGRRPRPRRAGNDSLRGGAGPDRLLGEGGPDFVAGGSGGDRLFGGPGRDLLRGGPGRDVCVGGPGADAYRGCEIRR